MKRLMKLTCQILNYNDAMHVIGLIEKIRKYRCIDYILVIDNCSKDNSYSLLSKRYMGCNNIIIVKTEANRGYGAGNNYGVKFAYYKLNSDYVLLVNSDVSFTEEVLNQMVSTLKNANNVGICSPTQIVNGNIIKDRAWKIPTKNEYIFSGTKLADLLSMNSLYPDSYFKREKSYVDCVPGAMLLLDSVKFLDVGGYDEKMFLYCEETTIGFKMKTSGYKTVLLNNYFYEHLQSSSIKKAIPDVINQRRLIYKNRLIFLHDYLKANAFYMYLAKGVYKHILKKLYKVNEND